MSSVIHRFLNVLSCAVIVSITVALPAGQGRGLGRTQPGSPGRKALGGISAPVPGALNSAAAVEALGGELGRRVRERGGSPEEYAALLAGDQSAWISAEGQLMFIDVVDHDLDADGNPVPEDVPIPTGPAPTPLSLLPNGLPVHHSKPGAPWTIYLDFDGEALFSSNEWRIFNRAITGFTIDADTSTFNVNEQAVISRLWGRVAEDWASFDVNVTTERPGAIGPTVLWSIVGKSPSEVGFPSFVGGVSLFNLGYQPFGLQTPTFTFWQPFGATDHSTIADVITQENGHMFGLLHDGLVAGGLIEYYGGHGTGPTSWGPVMGAPLARNVTQWSRGEYPGAINAPLGWNPYGPQDDIAIIARKLGFRADDFADTIADAGPLAQPTAGFITSTTDVDVFALPLANEVHIEITPFRAGELTDGGNLDVAADILNAAGDVVATVDDVNETAASLTADLPSTPHFLRVRPSFDPANYPAYASLGGYTVSGTFVRSVKLVDFQEPLNTSMLTAGRTIPLDAHGGPHHPREVHADRPCCRRARAAAAQPPWHRPDGDVVQRPDAGPSALQPEDPRRAGGWVVLDRGAVPEHGRRVDHGHAGQRQHREPAAGRRRLTDYRASFGAFIRR
jgi:hypothetical protein